MTYKCTFELMIEASGRFTYVGANKKISLIAYIVMMDRLYAETCSWPPEF